MSNNIYDKYDLVSGSHNYWRMSAKWPIAGKSDASIWAVNVIAFAVAAFFGGLMGFLWDVFYLVLILNVICKFSKLNAFQLSRWILQRVGVKRKQATPYWRQGSGFVLAFCIASSFLMVSPKVEATFEIIIPKAKPQIDPMVASGEHLIEGGFGRNVKMVDLMFQILPKPFEAEFYNSEIQDMKVSWFAKDRVFLNAIFADISRRHGLLFTWKPSSGLINVSWDKGQCRKVIAENDRQRSEDAATYQTQERVRPAYVSKVIDDVTGELIVC